MFEIIFTLQLVLFKKNIKKKANSALKLELLGIKTDHVRLTGEVMNPVHNKWTF